FTVGKLNSNIKTAYREMKTTWIFDPLLITETLDIGPWLYFREVLDYNLNTQSMTEAVRMFWVWFTIIR
ncbi:unnamed protein product, partial [marine sediment metagenome]